MRNEYKCDIKSANHHPHRWGSRKGLRKVKFGQDIYFANHLSLQYFFEEKFRNSYNDVLHKCNNKLNQVQRLFNIFQKYLVDLVDTAPIVSSLGFRLSVYFELLLSFIARHRREAMHLSRIANKNVRENTCQTQTYLKNPCFATGNFGLSFELGLLPDLCWYFPMINPLICGSFKEMNDELGKRLVRTQEQ
jgi:hypothetical protein